MINLTGWKVIYKNIIYRAMQADALFMPTDIQGENICKANEISVLAVNEDGEIISIRDKAECFRFIRDWEAQ